MKDTTSISLKGYLEITNQHEEIILKQENQITQNALEILIKSLNTLEGNIGINKLRVKGTAPTILKDMVEVTTSIVDSTIVFKSLIYESDFIGQINSLELFSTFVDKAFSIKENLGIQKDDTTRLQIKWTIIINKV